MFNNGTPKKGERFTPEDSELLLAEGRRHYTADRQRALRAKLVRIDAPILIVQGDGSRPEMPINRFNANVFIPELRAAGRQLQVSSYPPRS